MLSLFNSQFSYFKIAIVFLIGACGLFPVCGFVILGTSRLITT